MKPNQNLYNLIKSLSKSEKRYFKMYCSMQKGSKNYLKLFDEIDSQAESDEAEIRKKYSEEKFTNQLSFTKNYLYKLILQSLVSYRKNNSIDAQITDQINESSTLLERGLIKQYFQRLDHTLKIANKYERFSYVLQILEMKNIYTKMASDRETNKITSLQIQEVIAKIQNFHLYNNCIRDLTHLYREKGKIRSEEAEKYLSEIEENNFFNDPSKALSKRALENYYFIHQLLADFRCNDEVVFENCLLRLEIIEKYPEPFHDTHTNYAYDVLAYIITHFGRKRDEKNYTFYLNKLDALPVKNKLDEISLFFLRTYVVNVRTFFEQKWEEGIARILETKKYLNKYSEHIEGDMELLIRYQFIRIYIMSQKFDSALEEANGLFNHPKLKNRQEFEWSIRILFIIIHYELRNLSLLKYLLISTYRFLYKKKSLYRFERVFLDFIKKLPGTTEGTLNRLLSETRSELLLLQSDPFERNAFRYFDFVKWIERKLDEPESLSQGTIKKTKGSADKAKVTSGKAG